MGEGGGVGSAGVALRGLRWGEAGSEAEVHLSRRALYLLEVVVEVAYDGADVLMAEEELDLADIEARLQPTLDDQAAQAAEGVVIAAGGGTGHVEAGALLLFVHPGLEAAVL